MCVFFFQAKNGKRDLVRVRGLGNVDKRQVKNRIELERKKKVYIMPIWVHTGKTQPTKAKESVFTGQGK